MCVCLLSRLVLRCLAESRSLVESETELYSVWRNMAQMLMSTIERRLDDSPVFWGHVIV